MSEFLPRFYTLKHKTMPPSQLKRLKASLREQGITGQQRSKKDKKKQHGVNGDQRMQRQAALQGIRDAFNPFEVKAPSRPAKFETTTNRTINGKAAKGTVGRPGVTKSMGEEARRRQLLPEMQRRNKVGGVLDRRIGESDPTLTPEERALQRFTREKQKNRGSLFDLEEADDEDGLTHGGQALDFDGILKPKDDFDADDISGSDLGSGDEREDRPLKRRRSSVGSDEDGEEGDALEKQDGDAPARKKTKAEVMKEVMAKSKLYKFERQKNKEDDDDLREELDKGMSDMLALLQGHKPAPKPEEPASKGGAPSMNPDRLALLNGTSREKADKEYDARLRQLAMDKRAAPTDRTKTDEEKAAGEAQKLKDLERSRLRRMQGEVSDEEEEKPRKKKDEGEEEDDVVDGDDDVLDDAAEFGLSGPQPITKQLVLEDEDEFEMEDNLVASESEQDDDDSSDEDGSAASDDEAEPQDVVDEEEDEFVRGILNKDERKVTGANGVKPLPPSVDEGKGLAFAYTCPRTHSELLATIKDVAPEDVPTVVQRIRALYHPSLSAENKEKLADFSVALVDHISYMGVNKQPLGVIETLIRHLHSLSRTYPETIAKAFRTHLEAFHERGTPSPGDLVILTAIGSIYSTSDHFHQVVTPAITLMARWLGMTAPSTPANSTTGAFLVALSLRYQRLSKRYIPEAVRFTLKALQQRPQLSEAQLSPHIANLYTMIELWASKSAFVQIFSPAFLTALKPLSQPKALANLKIQLSQARLRQRPLELHHHRPQAIRSSIPKFEEGFNPDKHYDPDRERAESSKLRKEYKREKKGAVRELRKDASFMAREQLREKRERDAEYEKKYKRLVAEIQGQEGHEAKEYEREKRLRKGKK